MKKSDPFNTLSKAKDEIARLQLEIAQANKTNKPATANVSAAATNVSTDAVSAKAEELTLPAITIESLGEAIRVETDYKKSWPMMRLRNALILEQHVADLKASKKNRRS